MAIENRSKVVAGATLVARYKGEVVKCLVGTNEEGALTYTVNGKAFNSPSKAGSEAAGGTSVNGYRFWSFDGELGEGRKAAAPKAAGEKAPKATKPKATETEARGGTTIKKQRKQPEDLAEGSVSYFCTACMEPFTVSDGTKPTACPKGHTNAKAEAPAADATEPASEPAADDESTDGPAPTVDPDAKTVTLDI